MTPEEKAKELFKNMRMAQTGPGIEAGYGNAKSSALICIDEILSMLAPYKGMHDQEYFDGLKEFYQQVKTEIQKL